MSVATRLVCTTCGRHSTRCFNVHYVPACCGLLFVVGSRLPFSFRQNVRFSEIGWIFLGTENFPEPADPKTHLGKQNPIKHSISRNQREFSVDTPCAWRSLEAVVSQRYLTRRKESRRRSSCYSSKRKNIPPRWEPISQLNQPILIILKQQTERTVQSLFCLDCVVLCVVCRFAIRILPVFCTFVSPSWITCR